MSYFSVLGENLTQTIASNCLSIRVVLQSSHAAADSLHMCNSLIFSYSYFPCVLHCFDCLLCCASYVLSSVISLQVCSKLMVCFFSYSHPNNSFHSFDKKNPFTLSIPLIPVPCSLEGRRRVVQRKMFLFASLFYVPSTGLELCNFNDFRES